MQTAARTRSHQTQIVADLRHARRRHLQRRVEVEHAVRVRGRRDQIRRDLHVEARHFAQSRAGFLREVGMRRGARADRSAAQILHLERLRSDLDDLQRLAQRAGVAVELLAQRHGHGVLQLGSAHLQHVLELLRLLLEGVDQLFELLDESEVIQIHAQLARARVRVVRRLALVDVVVGTHDRVLSLVVAQDLQSAVGDHLIGAHVGGRASSALDHVHDEVVVQLSFDYLIASSGNGIHDLLLDEAKSTVRNNTGLLDQSVSFNEVPEAGKAHSSNVVVVKSAQRLNSVVGVLRDLHLSQEIRFNTEFLRVQLTIHNKKKTHTTSLMAALFLSDS